MSINATDEELYLTATSAYLSNGEAGNTDIEEVHNLRDIGPVISQPSPGIAPRTLIFNDITPSVNSATTIEDRHPGTTIEDTTQEGTDLTNEIVVHASTSIIHSLNPSINSLPKSLPTASSVPLKGVRVYENMKDLAAIHQAILTIEDNADGENLLDLADFKNKISVVGGDRLGNSAASTTI